MSAERARLLPWRAGEPAWNMAVDEALLEFAPLPTLRLYGWSPPGISLGRFQRDAAEIESLAATGLQLVRRMTGGGAIVHWHEVTYSLALPLDHPLIRGSTTRESYDRIHAPVAEALESLGVTIGARDALPESSPRKDAATLCFHRVTRLDLVAEGKKLVGSAQRRIEGRMLQHGSIVLRPNPHQGGTASLEELLGAAPETDAVCAALAASFSKALGGLDEGRLAPDERARAEKVAPTYRIV